MKTHKEEIKKKLVVVEKKKKKKTNDTDSAGKKFQDIQIEFQYIQIEFESKYKNSYLCELIMFCRLPNEAKKERRGRKHQLIALITKQRKTEDMVIKDDQ